MSEGYRDLQVWQRSKALAVAVYRFTSSPPLKSDYGLVDQMRRAAVSIPSNIAEGEARDALRESIRFLNIAKASAAELSTQLEIAAEVYDCDVEALSGLIDECGQVAKMLQGLIRSRQSKL